MGPGVIVPKTTTAKSNRAPAVSAGTESVAQILERERDSLIHDWLALVEEQEDLTGTANHPEFWPFRIANIPPEIASESILSKSCPHQTEHSGWVLL
jgi:hypothetical protein